MAFNPENFVRSSAQANGNATFNYSTTDDDASAVTASGYFDPASSLSGGYGLKDGDYIFARASDTTNILSIAVDAAGVASVSGSVAFA